MKVTLAGARAVAVLLAALALAFGRDARADDGGKVATFALIMGSNLSVDTDLPPLKYADDDAATYLDLFRVLGARTYLLSRLDDNTRRMHAQAAAEALEPRRMAFAQAVDPRVGLLLSTSPARESHEWDGFQAGVFSHEVRSGLYGAADADGDGRVSYREMAAFISQANGAIPNDRFRPRVLARAPRESMWLRRTRRRAP